MSRGSGLTGLAAMTRISAVPRDGEGKIKLVRPLLDIPKARLIATLRAAKVVFADDPSNRDPRFTRARLRGLMGELAREGLDSRRLALLAQRLRRADRAIDAVVDRAVAELTRLSPAGDAVAIDAAAYSGLPAEIALRLLGRAVDRVGDEGPVELAKLEALKSALDAAQISGNARFRRSLAGAIVTLAGAKIAVERAPPRRGRPLTTRRPVTPSQRNRARISEIRALSMPGHGAYIVNGIDVKSPRNSAIRRWPQRPTRRVRTPDERQSAQFRPLGDYRPACCSRCSRCSRIPASARARRTSRSRSC